jgi:translation initiation factor IF-2
MSRRRQKKKHVSGSRLHAKTGLDGKHVPEKIEIVLKCDVSGTVEAVTHSIGSIAVPGVEIDIIKAGIGRISKSDIMMALTGSRLVIGFNVGIMPKLEPHIIEHCVEVRLYNVIYELIKDIKAVALKLTEKTTDEKIKGKAKVIATFKGRRQGIVIGCEVLEGKLEVGDTFRIITAMGPAYFGKISSLQINRQAVKKVNSGQQAGIEVPNWKKARVGDLVESYEALTPNPGPSWEPTCRILKK